MGMERLDWEQRTVARMTRGLEIKPYSKWLKEMGIYNWHRGK